MFNLKDRNAIKSTELLKIIKDLVDLATNPNRQHNFIQKH